MSTLKEEAKEWTPTQIKNIADLDVVPLDFELVDAEGTADDGKTFTYKYMEVNGEKYRVPGKVIGDIKAILEARPNTAKVKVTKKGSGLQTAYTVIPLD